MKAGKNYRTDQRIPPAREGVIAEAHRIRGRIQTKYSTWNEDIVRLATAAVTVSKLRSHDVCAPEMVALTWLCLGGIRLRAHKGYLRYFHVDQGTWRPYVGLLPEQIFAYLRMFLNTLEGLFRSFTKKI